MIRFTSTFMLLLLAIALSPSLLKAQISIVSSDFEPPLQLRQTYTSYMDRTTTQVDIGTPGATSWDFSNLVVDNQFVTESKAVGTSPYASDFGGAGYASNYEGTFEGTFSNTWVYNSINSNNFLTHGTGTVANTTAGNVTTKIKYDPAWQQYTFPIQFGGSHTYTGTQTITTIVIVPILGEYPTTISQQVTVQQDVDAYGIVKMPNGKRVNAVRIKELTTFNNNGQISTSLIYRILAKTGEFVSVTPSDQSSTSGMVAVSALSWGDGRGESLPEEVTVSDPTGLTATAGENSIELSWTDNADNETGYKIERKVDGGDFSVLGEVAANSTSYTDNTAATGVTYIYRVKAYNTEAESGYSNTASAMIEAPLVTVSDPTGLTAIAGESNIELSWTDNADNETGYKIERKVDGGDYSVLGEVAANSTSYTDNTAATGVTYIYRVKAYNAEAESGYSNTASAMIEAPLITVSDPTGLTATAGENNIELSWTDNADNETGYKIERKVDGGDYSVLGEVAVNSTSYTDNTAETGVTYIYRVKAYNTVTESGYSNTASAMIEAPLVTVSDPTGLTATAGENNIELSWTDNADNETGYKVERKVDGGDFSVLGEVAANSTSYIDNTAETGVTYIYRVKAYNTVTESGYSNTASAMIEAPLVTVSDPTGLTATAGESNIELSWTDNANNETGYKIERKVDGGDYSVLGEVAANSTSYTDNTAATGVTYIYRVKAYNTEAESGYSNTASAMIEAPLVTVSDPTGLTATAGENNIELSWTDNANNETGYKVERQADGGDFSVMAELPANSNSYTDNTVEAGVNYSYRVQAYNADAISGYSNITSLSIEITAVIDRRLADVLVSNYPNPFSNKTTISLTLNNNYFTTITVLSIDGRLIETLVSEELNTGKHEFNFDATGLQNGLYIYSIQTGSRIQMHKMMLQN